MQSENAEMYLVTLALLEEQGTPTPISIPRLAEELDVQVVSANQMIRKLEEEGLVSYQPYKGVSFSPQGAEHAQAFLRNRRLWETFFIEHLGYTPREADALACRMEHITEPEMARRLSHFLNDPKASPTGNTISQPGSRKKPVADLRLSSLHAGQSAEVVKLRVDQATTRYLKGQQLSPGAKIEVLAVSGDGEMLVSTPENNISITAELAGLIQVSITEDN
ncbi:MAG: metal-dependent transcriptional regulator [Chloroflexota bacterium]